METITNVRELICAYYQKHPDGHFFDRDTLKFFGETRSGMRLLKGTRIKRSASGDVHTCYCISARRRTWSGTLARAYHYFDVETLEDVVT